MRVNNFFKFSLSSLNLWTILAFTAVGCGLLYDSSSTNFSEAKQIELPATSNQIARRVITPSVVNIPHTTTLSEETTDMKNKNSKNTYSGRSQSNISKTIQKTTSTNKTSLVVKNQTTSYETKEKTSKNTIKLSESSNPIEITNPELKEDKTQVEENITTCKTVNVKNNRFNGSITLDKFQTASTGLNNELRNKTKKEFTIKIKVPK